MQMPDVPRISAEEVRRKMHEDPDRVHLICAYDDEDKCREYRLDGSVSLKVFQQHLADVDREDVLAFYCA